METVTRRRRLPLLEGIELELTAEQVFSWLKMGG